MRDAAGKHSHGLHLLRLPQLLFQTNTCAYFRKQDDQVPLLIGVDPKVKLQGGFAIGRKPGHASQFRGRKVFGEQSAAELFPVPGLNLIQKRGGLEAEELASGSVEG